MSRKKPVADVRERELVAEIERFETLARIALGHAQCPKCDADIPCEKADVKAAVSAESQASSARSRLSDLRGELDLRAITDPVVRLESLRTLEPLDGPEEREHEPTTRGRRRGPVHDVLREVSQQCSLRRRVGLGDRWIDSAVDHLGSQ